MDRLDCTNVQNIDVIGFFMLATQMRFAVTHGRFLLEKGLLIS